VRCVRLCVCLSLFELREGGFLQVGPVAAYVLQHLFEEHDGRREEQHHLREKVGESERERGGGERKLRTSVNIANIAVASCMIPSTP
jgi:hypothetical protein